MLNFLFFPIIIVFFPFLALDTHLKAGYEFVHAFHHLRYSTFYFFTIVPDIQNRSSCSPFGGVEKGCISAMKGIPLAFGIS
ncbi:hypothetical protein HOY80DRAFT_971287, partial [Tuber brumale]